MWGRTEMLRATKVALALTIFVSAFICTLAQDRALISGDVQDRQDTPISGAKVVLRNDSLRIERSTTTNSDGLYFFAEVVPAEGYVITSTAPGLTFSPASVKFDVEVGETRHILPSFVGDKLPATVSSLQLRGRLPAVFNSLAPHANRAADSVPIAWLVGRTVLAVARPYSVRSTVTSP